MRWCIFCRNTFSFFLSSSMLSLPAGARSKPCCAPIPIGRSVFQYTCTHIAIVRTPTLSNKLAWPLPTSIHSLNFLLCMKQYQNRTFFPSPFVLLLLLFYVCNVATIFVFETAFSRRIQAIYTDVLGQSVTIAL